MELLILSEEEEVAVARNLALIGRKASGDDSHKHWLDRERNRLLREALHKAAGCEQHIEPEQERLRGLLAESDRKSVV